MEGSEFTTKGIKREARTLLADNWSRALASLCFSLFALAVVLLINQLAISLVDAIRSSDNSFVSVAGIQLPGLSRLQQYFKGSYIDLTISGIIFAFYFLFISPLELGITKWYMSLVRRENLQVGQIFDYYRSNSQFILAISFELRRVIRHLFFGALSMMPSILSFAFAVRSRRDGNIEAAEMMNVAGSALLIAGIIIYVIIITRFFLARYIFITGMGHGIGNCFYLSKKYMRGNIGRVLGVMFSFALWALSCIPDTAACRGDTLHPHDSCRLCRQAAERSCGGINLDKSVN